jgi:DNA-binding CsgD family transcriptional regulator
MNERPTKFKLKHDRHLLAVAAVMVVQAVAGIFFMADAIGDVLSDGVGFHVAIEGLIAFALMAGIILGAGQVRMLLNEAKRRDDALAIASGALADLIQERFGRWMLTAAEADVALFTLKGFGVSEIAELRNSAPGTVRAQLTRVYAKAGVDSRGALVSLFFDELLDRS